jgi:PAS domain S-box-containing protein
MLDAVKQAVIGMKPDGSIFFWNRAAAELFGWSADQVVGSNAVELIGIEPASAEAAPDDGAEVVLRRRDGSTFPALIVDSPLGNARDGVIGTVRLISDISERLADQRAQRFLAGAGSELASTLDYQSLMTAVALLAVPTLGDCCFVDVVEEEKVSRRIESVWSSTLAGDDDTRLSRHVYETESKAAALLHKGETAILSRITPDVLRALTQQPDEIVRLERAGVRSAIVAPLKAGGRTLGTLAFAAVDRAYSKADATLIAEFARRVALAADNAILYEAAKLANQAKSDFLAVMSHELRTPLTTVMGYTDLLLAEVSGALSDQSRTYVGRVRTAAWHLLGLIEQILIYARVEVGREQVHIQRVPVDFVLRDAAALIEPVAAEKGLRFELKQPQIAAYVDTDLTKLRQILLNLLSNAVKFTESGSVTLEADISDTQVSFNVSDTGIGIAPEHLERVFDSFWQVDQSATRHAGGTGLGLSVARRLALLLGGNVSASSDQKGSVFKLVLPKAHLGKGGAPALDANSTQR